MLTIKKIKLMLLVLKSKLQKVFVFLHKFVMFTGLVMVPAHFHDVSYDKIKANLVTNTAEALESLLNLFKSESPISVVEHILITS